MNCKICEKTLRGKQSLYCSNECRFMSSKFKSSNKISGKKRKMSRKLHFVEKLGGCCSICGYNKNIASLEFHHINNEHKTLNLSSTDMKNNNLSILLEEIDKCVLLCSNCHREHHNNELNNFKNLNLETDTVNNIENVTSDCSICGNKLKSKQRKYCSKKCSNVNNGRNRQSYKNQKNKAIKRKIMLVNLLGGKCNMCSYDYNLAVLEFNHLNPINKTHTLDSRKLANSSLEFCLEEVKKCNLLCSNCHREHHNKHLDVT